MGNSESSSSQVPSPSQRGQFKVNFDGSVKEDGKGRAGFVIRNASGRAILVGNIVFVLCTEKQKIQDAELRGAWEGLREAVQRLHATSIWLEGDSQSVIDWINGANRPAPLHFDSKLQDIRMWRNTLNSFKATHVSEKGNKSADWLADTASSTTLRIWSADEFPDRLRALLDEDASFASRFPFGGDDGVGDGGAPFSSSSSSSSMGTAVKVGAALAGTALLALGAWSLSSPSAGAGDPPRRRTTMEEWDPEGSSGGYSHRPPPDPMRYSFQAQGPAFTHDDSLEAEGVAVTWTLPESGQLKVNFDGSVRGDAGRAGFVIRDGNARAIRAGNVVFDLCSDHKIHEAELRGAWEGFQAALELLKETRKLSIWLEGDSKTVIDWIKEEYKPAYFDPKLQDIVKWKNSNAFYFKATFVPRDANKPANWLAGNAVSFPLQNASSGFPASLLNLLSEDEAACGR